MDFLYWRMDFIHSPMDFMHWRVSKLIFLIGGEPDLSYCKSVVYGDKCNLGSTTTPPDPFLSITLSNRTLVIAECVLL